MGVFQGFILRLLFSTFSYVVEFEIWMVTAIQIMEIITQLTFTCSESDVVLVVLLLTLNIFLIFSRDFEQVNVSWQYPVKW